MKQFLFVIAFILTIPLLTWSQEKDTLIVTDTSGKVVASKKVRKETAWRDSAGSRIYKPGKAALYSAICPGLGQIYNRKYWKVPIVYAAIGIPVYTFFDNRTWYNRTRYALAVAESTTPNTPEYADSLNNVHSSLLPLVQDKQTNSLLNYRNEFRKNMDYSILFTLLFWGLNVVDATVDAHLKGFNVNENLSMQIKPAVISNRAIGLSFVFKFDDKQSK